MKSIKRLGSAPVSLPLSADNIVEFHAARLLLLISICGTGDRIDGLTKMAKLDFFVRYPDFFAVAKKYGAPEGESRAVESAMVRHHYGPWDKRYYHVLAYLESKRLIEIAKKRNSYLITLTDNGKEKAASLGKKPSFAALVDRMKAVKKEFGPKSGSTLKKLIYQLFDEEVGKKPLGEVIRR
ncbi:hypothetical protein [Bradyrhizobium sp.]|uniref:hypothetical protein n=1 Tax=Bradyrhizobium sp. TaxID=376 RepID=UPI00403849AF